VAGRVPKGSERKKARQARWAALKGKVMVTSTVRYSRASKERSSKTIYYGAKLSRVVRRSGLGSRLSRIPRNGLDDHCLCRSQIRTGAESRQQGTSNAVADDIRTKSAEGVGYQNGPRNAILDGESVGLLESDSAHC